jgi:large subunit ribosomal protein L21
MYAVIRSGGKQYRVAPGDVIKVESLPQARANERVQFEVLAVNAEDGGLKSPKGTTVVGQVLDNGRHDKILVFHFKRKKQYKRLRGHRQPFTQVRISEITVDGQRFAAPELPVKVKKEKPVKAEPAAAAEAHEEPKAAPAKKAAARKPAAKKPAAKPAAKKSAGKPAGKKKH